VVVTHLSVEWRDGRPPIRMVESAAQFNSVLTQCGSNMTADASDWIGGRIDA
jgi:hypothetical protein